MVDTHCVVTVDIANQLRYKLGGSIVCVGPDRGMVDSLPHKGTAEYHLWRCLPSPASRPLRRVNFEEIDGGFWTFLRFESCPEGDFVFTKYGRRPGARGTDLPADIAVRLVPARGEKNLQSHRQNKRDEIPAASAGGAVLPRSIDERILARQAQPV